MQKRTVWQIIQLPPHGTLLDAINKSGYRIGQRLHGKTIMEIEAVEFTDRAAIVLATAVDA